MKDDKKTSIPPYAPYKSFTNFINGLRENGCPSHITRSLLPGSNSGKAMMAATLKYLKLVEDHDTPSKKMLQLTDSDSNYGEVLNEILHDSYTFLNDPDLDLANTTTEKVTEKFKELGASGSTISKCMAFFLAAARDANIEISRYVKSPLPERKKSAAQKKRKAYGMPKAATPEPAQQIPELNDMDTITIPLREMQDGTIHLPKEMSTEQAEKAVQMVSLILKNYYGINE